MSLPFIGRTQELNSLSHLLQKRSASLVIVKGRRRIGKSRLIEEFAKRNSFDATFYFSGIPTTKKTTAQSQRDEFALQLGKALNIPGIKADDWNTLFLLLADRVKKGRNLILFDEISWMGSLDFDFLGKFKNAWDLDFSKNPKLIFVLCGSVSAWIEKNIIQSTGFLGRPSLYLTLEELTLQECYQFWGGQKQKVSAYEKFKLLSVIGGIPRYLELMDPTCSAEENIKRLCFMKDSPLLNEFDFIFSDIFSQRSTTYKRIVEQLIQGPADQDEISHKTRLTRSGDLSDYLNELVISGFIARDYTWHLKTSQISKLSKYRLKDNYLRFYLKYLQSHKAKIEKGIFNKSSLTSLSNWDIIMGLQFENLVLNSHLDVIRAIGIQPDELIFSNPFFQRHTARQPGCQIDYLIQTKFDTAYICEIKFSRSEIGLDIISEMTKKMKNLKLPRHFSYRPVLIHVNGVREEVKDSEFFSKIIDFGKFLAGGI
jgi:AAA+ ATPase superfamily predicted ATPase